MVVKQMAAGFPELPQIKRNVRKCFMILVVKFREVYIGFLTGNTYHLKAFTERTVWTMYTCYISEYAHFCLSVWRNEQKLWTLGNDTYFVTKWDAVSVTKVLFPVTTTICFFLEPFIAKTLGAIACRAASNLLCTNVLCWHNLSMSSSLQIFDIYAIK